MKPCDSENNPSKCVRKPVNFKNAHNTRPQNRTFATKSKAYMLWIEKIRKLGQRSMWIHFESKHTISFDVWLWARWSMVLSDNIVGHPKYYVSSIPCEGLDPYPCWICGMNAINNGHCMSHALNNLHFLIARTERFIKCKESFCTEIPLSGGEELQNIQTITDTRLNTTHAEWRNEKWSIKYRFPNNWEVLIVKYLQSWLAEAQHQEVNNIGRYPVVEDHLQCMHEFVCGHVAAWIPNASFEWILIIQFFAKVKYFAPCDFLAVRASHIENGNVSWSANQLNFLDYISFSSVSLSCVSTHFSTVVPIL